MGLLYPKDKYNSLYIPPSSKRPTVKITYTSYNKYVVYRRIKYILLNKLYLYKSYLD